MKRLLKVPLFSLMLLMGAAAVPAMAAEPVRIGDFGQWSAYEFQENGSPVCYMAAKPTSTAPKGARRGEIGVLITHRPGEGSRNVFSYMTGYGYKKGSEVEVTIDGRKFMLFTQNDMAWAPDTGADNALADAIKRGNKMVVKGVSARGTNTTDTYSLSGSTKAHEAISAKCGV